MRLQQKPIYGKQSFKAKLVNMKAGNITAIHSSCNGFRTNHHLIPSSTKSKNQEQEDNYIELPLFNSVGISVSMPVKWSNICIIGNRDNQLSLNKLASYLQRKFKKANKFAELLSLSQFLRLSNKERNNPDTIYIVNIDSDDTSKLVFKTISSSFSNFFISKPFDLQPLCNLIARVCAGNHANEIISLVSSSKNFDMRKYLLASLTTEQFWKYQVIGR